MRRRPWSDADRAVVVARYADEHTEAIAADLGRPVESVYTLAHRLGLLKSKRYMAERHGRHAAKAGKATQFKPGLVPWNKGTNFVAGGRSAQTRFQPGNRPHTWVPIGTLRINGDGYLDRKVTDDGRGPRDWVAVHRLVWIEAHGPIPDGHVVVFRPGRRTADPAGITPDALELVTRQELMRRNSVERMPKALADLARLRGALNRKMNEASK